MNSAQSSSVWTIPSFLNVAFSCAPGPNDHLMNSIMLIMGTVRSIVYPVWLIALAGNCSWSTRTRRTGSKADNSFALVANPKGHLFHPTMTRRTKRAAGLLPDTNHCHL
jgi:hypothetical protein